MSIDRRDFLWLLGGAGSGLLASRLPLPGLVAGLDDEDRIAAASFRGVEEHVTSSCLLCPGACGIRARKVDGQLVRIVGNSNHPVTRGGMCPKGISGAHLLYSPNRIKRPLKRVGHRGEGVFEPIEWEEALDLVGERLGTVRAERPQALAIFDGSHRGSMTALLSRFARAFGTPNHVRDYYHDGMELAALFMHGQRRLFAWDLPRSRFVLSFGTALLDAWWSPVWAARAYGELHQGREDTRGELVHFDSRQSTTAVKADRWIPTRPGTYGALALGIAYVIVKEDLYDSDFVEAHVHGFEEWRDHLLEEISLDQISEVSGVEIAAIIGTAKEFARKRPAVAIADQTATQGPDGALTAMAIHALNVLVGSVEQEGGVLLAPAVPYASMPSPGPDEAAAAGLAHERVDGAGGHELPMATDSVIAALEAIADVDPCPIEVLLLYHSNPAFSVPQVEQAKEALDRIPMIVSFSPFLDESAMMADLVLPDHTYLERWDDVVHPGVHPYPTVGIVRPVVAPLFHTRHSGDVLLALAGRLGTGVEEAFPWASYEEYLRARLEGVYEAHRGTEFAEPFEESQVRLFEESGFWLRGFDSYDDFWSKVVASGGWVDPVYHFKEWGRVVETPSRRIELRSSILERVLEASGGAMLRDPFPQLEQARHPGMVGETSPEEGFLLVVFRPLTLSSGTLAMLPWMHEILGYQSNVMWDSWVEIHTEQARALGVVDGDAVTLISAVGALSTQARLRSGGPPGVLHMPYGLGHEALGRFAEGIGAAAGRLVELETHGPLGGGRLMLPVRLEKGAQSA